MISSIKKAQVKKANRNGNTRYVNFDLEDEEGVYGYTGENRHMVECFRKGETPMEAGPDFSAADVKKCQDLFEAIAPVFIGARPEKF